MLISIKGALKKLSFFAADDKHGAIWYYALFWITYISASTKHSCRRASSWLSSPPVLRGKNKRAVVGTALNFLKTCINKSCPSSYKTGLIVAGNSSRRASASPHVTTHTHTQTRIHTPQGLSECVVREGWGFRFWSKKQGDGSLVLKRIPRQVACVLLKSVLTVSVLRVNDAPHFYSPSNTSPNTQLFYSNMNHDSFNIWFIPNKEKCHHLLINAL